MKNQYVGDIGDFGKYGLLRALTRDDENIRLGVVWYLTFDEDKRDGHRTDWPHHRELYEECDTELFRSLKALLDGRQRSVVAIRMAGILPPGTVFVETRMCLDLDDNAVAATVLRKKHRDRWTENASQAVKDCNVVSLDPDNGLGGKSFHPYWKNGYKHADPEEVKRFGDSGRRSLVLYHHAGRLGSYREQADKLRNRVAGILPHAALVKVLRFNDRFFVAVSAREHAAIFEERVQDIRAGPFGRHFGLMP